MLLFFAFIYAGFVLGVVTDRLILRHEQKNKERKPPNPESGSVFTILLAGIALAAAISLSLYQTASGPVASIVRVTNKNATKIQMQSISSIVIMAAANQANNGDCDGDSSIEPPVWRTGAGPTGGGLVPLTLGATVTDPWGTDYGYCVWDVGAFNDPGVDNGCGAAVNRRKGSPTPVAGNAVTQTVIAVVSAGPNRMFSTTCSDYVDATTDVITTGGDDVVQRFTYTEAATAIDGLWSLKVGAPDTAIIDKKLEVGTGATMMSVDTGSGLVSAAAVTTTGKVIAQGGVTLGTEATVVNGDCTALTDGLIRYNTTTNKVQVCDASGPAWADVGSGGGPIDDLTDAETDYVTLFNMFLGENSGAAITTGNYNTALGISALAATAGGASNSAFGYNALLGNTSGSGNTALGSLALAANTTKVGSTALGFEAMRYADSAAGGATTYNTAVGYQALRGSTTAASNTGTSNTAIGSGALVAATSGSQNTALGRDALNTVTTGSGNIAVGYNVQAPAAGTSNWLNIGDTLVGDLANKRLAIGTGITSVTTGLTLDMGATTGAMRVPNGTDAQKPVCAAGTMGGFRYQTDGTAGLYYCDSTNWIRLLGGSAVAALDDLTDATTDYATNYNMLLGSAGSGDPANNGSGNTALGYYALKDNSSGTNNVAVGSGALYSNVTRVGSTAVGYQAMYYATDAAGGATTGNTALGYQALMGSSTAANNIGLNNTAVGASALASITGGNNNTAVGRNALKANDSGSANTSVGFQALGNNTSGNYSVAVGASVLVNNTSGSYNTATGYWALLNNTSGGNNTAVGSLALVANTTGAANTAVGTSALSALTTGTNNVALGYQTGTANNGGTAISTGTNNTLLGYQAVVDSAIATNRTAIGYQAIATADNQMVFGNSSVTLQTMSGTGAVVVPNGTVAQAPACNASYKGGLRYQTDGTAGFYSCDGAGTWTTFGSAIKLNNLTAANATNTIDSLNYDQTWNWSTLAGGSTAMTLAATNAGAVANTTLAVSNATTGAGYGVKATMSGAGNTGYAGYFTNASPSGSSVYAENTSTTGANNFAGYFKNASTVLGSTFGVYSIAAGWGGFGVYGLSTTGAGGYGVYGVSQSTGGFGVTTAHGVYGANTGNGNLGAAVKGVNSSSTAVNYGGYFTAATTAAGYGLYSSITGAANSGYGVYGANTSATNTGYGGYFSSSNKSSGSNGAALGVDGFMTMTGVATASAPAVSAANTGRIYYDTTSQTFKLSLNGGAYSDLGGCSTIDCLSDAISDTTSTVFLGTGSGVSNTTGGTAALGINSLHDNTTGGANTAIGTGALYTNTTKSGSTAVGYQAMRYADSAAGGATTANTAVGVQALYGSVTAASNTGTYNTAVGYQALLSQTSGTNNVALGSQALYSSSTAGWNTAVGHGALFSVTTGGANTAIGHLAGWSGTPITTGTYNTFIGFTAGSNNAAYTNGTAIGNGAVLTASNRMVFGNSSVTSQIMSGTGTVVVPNGTAAQAPACGSHRGGIRYQTDGTAGFYGCNGVSWSAFGGGATDIDSLTDGISDGVSNVFLGAGSGQAGAGAGNVALGTSSLPNITTGTYNIAIGHNALSSTTTGNYNIAIGLNTILFGAANAKDVAIGHYAMSAANPGANNVAIGYEALKNDSVGGGDNVAVGYQAGDNNTSGSNNTYIGSNTGGNITTGNQNTFIGRNADSNGNYNNSMALGYNATVTCADCVQIGNGSVTRVYFGTGAGTPTLMAGMYVTASDRRLKKDITESDLGLEFIEKLRPVSYRFKEGSPVLRYGFIAQEVEDALAGRNVGMITRDSNKLQTYHLDYDELIAPLTKAVQELAAKTSSSAARFNPLEDEVTALKAQVTSQTDQLSKQTAEIETLKAAIETLKAERDKAAGQQQK